MNALIVHLCIASTHSRVRNSKIPVLQTENKIKLTYSA